MKKLFSMLLLTMPSLVFSASLGGVCIGPDLSKIVNPTAQAVQIKIKVDSQPEVVFSEFKNQLAFKNLDTSSKHKITVIESADRTYFRSFSFQSLKSDYIVVFRDAGGWKISAADRSCRWPTASCPKGYGCKKNTLWLHLQ